MNSELQTHRQKFLILLFSLVSGDVTTKFSVRKASPKTLLLTNTIFVKFLRFYVTVLELPTHSQVLTLTHAYSKLYFSL